MPLDEKIKTQVYDFLEETRKGGSINMWGAGLLVAEEFNLTQEEGKLWLTEWIKSKTVNVPVSGVSSKVDSGDV